jgi:hypothetical protein
MSYIEQSYPLPEPVRFSSVYELEFEGYADGEFKQVTVAIPEHAWEEFKASILAA